MKNKMFIKFLTALISTAFVLGSSGQILATTTNKKENNQLESLERREKLEKGMLEKNIETFKNFNRKNYEVDGFNLTVYFKNGAPILYYEHIKTGAKIVIIPTDTVPKNSNFIKFQIATFNFNISTENSKNYLANFVGNVIKSNFNYKDLKKFENFNVYSNNPNLAINFNVDDIDDINFLKKALLYLKDPKIFKDEKTFNLEKKRALNYIKNRSKEPDAFPLNVKIEDAEKLTKDEIFNFYKERIHPSNLLVTRHESFKNIKGILNFLKILDENYLKYYNFKKNNFKPYGTKVESVYNVQPFSNANGTPKEDKKYKFDAYLDFLIDPSNCISDVFIEKHPLLNNHRVSEELLKNIKIKEYIKKLGYLDGHFNFSNLSLYANEKSLFEKEKLKENSSKIFNYVLDNIKNIKEKEIKEICEKTIFPKEQNEYRLFANPIIFNANLGLRNHLEDNFIYYNDPFSKEFFEITPNNEIKDSKENSINRILKDFKNIETIRKEFNENQYCNISVTSKEMKEDEKKQDEKHMYNVLIPIKLKQQNKNSLLEYLAKHFLTRNFLDTKSYEKALPNHDYYSSAAPFLGDYIGQYRTANEELSKDSLNFYYEEFEDSIKNYEITKEDFEEIKKDFINSITNKKFVSSFNSGIEIIENFLKNGYEEKNEGENTNRFFKITTETPRILMFRHYYFLLKDCLFENFDEFIEFAKKFSEFVKRHNVKSNEKDVKVTKEFARDLLENILNPLKKIVKRTENLKKKFENNLEKISFEEFVNCVKSAKTVEKEQLEKDQKTIRELEEDSSYLIF